MHPLLKRITTQEFWSLRRLFFIGLVLVIGIVLFIPLRNFYEKNIIEGYLSHIEEIIWWLRDTIMIIVYAVIIIGCLRLYRYKKQIIADNILLLVVAAGAYYFAAAISGRYIFFGFFNSAQPMLYYANCFIPATVGAVWLLYRNRTIGNAPKKINIDTVVDELAKRRVDDLYGRSFFAVRIARIMKDIEAGHEAYTIGINGSWGSGKTWFMDEIRKQFHARDFIIMTFNPWKYDNATVIIQSFFKEFADNFSKNTDRQLIKDLHEYAKKLVEVDENMFTRMFHVITEHFSVRADEKTNDIYERLNEKIRKQDKGLLFSLMTLTDLIRRKS